MSKSKILFFMTGSIACYKACNIISKLVQADFEVQVVASKSALEFVGNATLEGLTGKPTITDLWSPGNIMAHIHLMRWADLVLVAPATSNYINKISQGVGDDLLTTLFLAHDFKKPFLIAPAMNTSMYLHPVTQKSIQVLKSFKGQYGIEILESASGVLACGEVGYGKLLEPELIMQEIVRALSLKPEELAVSTRTAPKNPLHILLTSGGTSEPIDDVRVLTNKSTGQTGARLADTLMELGLNVTFLHAERSAVPSLQCQKISFETFHDLETTLNQQLSTTNFDAVIHLAAVSDYSIVDGKFAGKISSEPESLTIHLKKNPKLVNVIKKISLNKSLKLVAFKMTSTPDIQKREIAVKKLFHESSADVVVHNDLSEIDVQAKTHLFHWHDLKNNKTQTLQDANQLGHKLAAWLFDLIPSEKV